MRLRACLHSPRATCVGLGELSFSNKTRHRAIVCRYKRGKGVHRRPKRLPRGMLSWIVAVYKIKQEEVIEVAGYDAATYMRILTMGALCCRSSECFLLLLRKR